jgi:hypothetical protein
MGGLALAALMHARLAPPTTGAVGRTGTRSASARAARASPWGAPTTSAGVRRARARSQSRFRFRVRRLRSRAASPEPIGARAQSGAESDADGARARGDACDYEDDDDAEDEDVDSDDADTFDPLAESNTASNALSSRLAAAADDERDPLGEGVNVVNLEPSLLGSTRCGAGDRGRGFPQERARAPGPASAREGPPDVRARPLRDRAHARRTGPRRCARASWTLRASVYRRERYERGELVCGRVGYRDCAARRQRDAHCECERERGEGCVCAYVRRAARVLIVPQLTLTRARPSRTARRRSANSRRYALTSDHFALTHAPTRAAPRGRIHLHATACDRLSLAQVPTRNPHLPIPGREERAA